PSSAGGCPGGGAGFEHCDQAIDARNSALASAISRPPEERRRSRARISDRLTKSRRSLLCPSAGDKATRCWLFANSVCLRVTPFAWAEPADPCRRPVRLHFFQERRP